MIINIPLQIDEKNLEEVVARDYDDKITKEIVAQINRAIANNSPYQYGDRVLRGMEALVEKKLREFVDEHKDEIIDMASDKLSERLMRTKKAKEVLNNLTEDQNG